MNHQNSIDKDGVYGAHTVKLLFFIPSFNDQLGLPELVQRLLDEYPTATALIIDDGSTPQIDLSQGDLLLSKRSLLLRLPFNVGLGLVTSVALDYFLNNDFDFLIRLDADGQHPIEEISYLLAPLMQGLSDIVWGERINHLSLGSTRAVMGSVIKQATGWVGRRVLYCDLNDWFSGFFAINRNAGMVVSNVFLERYCELQMLCIFHRSSMKIRIHRFNQVDRRFGQSTISFAGGLMIFFRSMLLMFRYLIIAPSKNARSDV